MSRPMRRSSLTRVPLRNRRKPLRRGTAPARKTKLDRVSELAREVRIRLHNAERKKRKFARNYGPDGKHGAWIRSQACAVQAFSPAPTTCLGEHEAAHASDRGMGGCKGDRTSLLCLCHRHHAEHGEGHVSFETRYQINCKDIAAQMWAGSPYGAAWEAAQP